MKHTNISKIVHVHGKQFYNLHKSPVNFFILFNPIHIYNFPCGVSEQPLPTFTTFNSFYSMAITPVCFEAAGFALMRKARGCTSTGKRRFRSMFGISATVCSICYGNIVAFLPDSAQPKHPLYSLMFMRLYVSENVNCFMAGCDEKTFRKQVWIFNPLIADMRVVC